MTIHPTAIIDKSVEVGKDVSIGPYCVVGPQTEIGEGSILDSHVQIHGWTTIGENCRFYSFSSIGSNPQDLKYRGEVTYLRIGKANIFREFVTINRGTQGGGGLTALGEGNLFMAYSHVAHDSVVGSHVIMANSATLAGHVIVEDHATIGAFSAVHQFCRVGQHAFIGGFSVITRDALPYIKTVGDRNQAKIYGVNSVGLQRRGIPESSIEALKQVYRILFRSKVNRRDALRQARDKEWAAPEVEVLIQFIESATRGYVH